MSRLKIVFGHAVVGYMPMLFQIAIIPLLLDRFGQDGYSIIVYGLSIWGLCGLLINFGYNILGIEIVKSDTSHGFMKSIVLYRWSLTVIILIVISIFYSGSFPTLLWSSYQVIIEYLTFPFWYKATGNVMKLVLLNAVPRAIQIMFLVCGNMSMYDYLLFSSIIALIVGLVSTSYIYLKSSWKEFDTSFFDRGIAHLISRSISMSYNRLIVILLEYRGYVEFIAVFDIVDKVLALFRSPFPIINQFILSEYNLKNNRLKTLIGISVFSILLAVIFVIGAPLVFDYLGLGTVLSNKTLIVLGISILLVGPSWYMYDVLYSTAFKDRAMLISNFIVLIIFLLLSNLLLRLSAECYLIIFLVIEFSNLVSRWVGLRM